METIAFLRLTLQTNVSKLHCQRVLCSTNRKCYQLDKNGCKETRLKDNFVSSKDIVIVKHKCSVLPLKACSEGDKAR